MRWWQRACRSRDVTNYTDIISNNREGKQTKTKHSACVWWSPEWSQASWPGRLGLLACFLCCSDWPPLKKIVYYEKNLLPKKGATVQRHSGLSGPAWGFGSVTGHQFLNGKVNDQFMIIMRPEQVIWLSLTIHLQIHGVTASKGEYPLFSLLLICLKRFLSSTCIVC